MTVKEFSALLGISSSKIRFYDRLKIIEGNREANNNYRNFSNIDALNIYNAQMLRSFNFSIQEVLEAKEEQLEQIDKRLKDRISELEKTIREQEVKLARLKEMTAYFSKVKENIFKYSYHELEDCYNIFTINCESTEEDQEAVKALAELMPFSYICLKISKESILNEELPLKVSMGLGILESNRIKTGLTFPPSIKIEKKQMYLGMFLECHDIFNIKRSDIKTLLDEIKEKNIPITEDLIGRVFISYNHDGILVHGVCFGIKMLDL